MKLIKLSVGGLMLFKEKVEIDFFTEQNVMSDKREMLSNPFGKIYTNNVLSIVGINASGKTSLLKVLSFVLKMLNGESINNINSRDILTESKLASFEVIFYDDNGSLCKLTTKIQLASENDLEERYIIKEEALYKKKVSLIRAKKDMFIFDDNDFQMRRDNQAEFLKDDISIVISINKNNGFKTRDLINLTNLNFLGMIGDFPRELIEFLDPNIKRISYNKKSKEINLEFHEREMISVSNPVQLERYLSSGTIKGINIFLSAMMTFNDGGYLIIDEIENHFNREIVATLVRFFMSETVNKRGATLIFSTHYSELLDEIDRNDNIYIVRNRGGITVQKLYKILKRNDLKKSDAFKSDFLEGTVPSYDAYINFKNAIINGKIGEE